MSHLMSIPLVLLATWVSHLVGFLLGILIYIGFAIIVVYFGSKRDKRRLREAIVKASLCAALEDGDLTDEEGDLLAKTCNQLGVHRHTFEGLTREINRGNSSVYIPSTKDEKKEVISYVAKMILVDGDINQSERRIYNRLGKAYGVSQEDLKAILEQAKEEKTNSTND